MANGFLAFRNLAQTATLTAGAGVVASLPAVNLQDPEPSQACRQIGTSWSVIADHGADVSLELFCLISTNLSPAATVRARVTTAASGDATAAGGSYAWDSGTLSAGALEEYRGNVMVLAPSPALGRWSRLDVNDSDPIRPAGQSAYIDGGIYWTGMRWSVSRNFDNATEIGFMDTGMASQGAYGAFGTKRGARPRTVRFGLGRSYVAEAEAFGDMWDLDRLCGITEPVIYCRNPDWSPLAQLWFYGIMPKLDPIAQTARTKFGKPYQVIEWL